MIDDVENHAKDGAQELRRLGSHEDAREADGEDAWDDLDDEYPGDGQGFDFDPPDDYAEQSNRSYGDLDVYSAADSDPKSHDTAETSNRAMMGGGWRGCVDRLQSEFSAYAVTAPSRVDPGIVSWQSVPECELLLQQHVHLYFSCTRPTITRLYYALSFEMWRENNWRSMHDLPAVTIPSKATFARRIAQLDQYSVHAARYGARTAKRRFG